MNVKVNNLKRTDSSVVRLWVQHFCCFVFFCFFVFNHCCSDKGGIYKQDINIEVKHPQFPQCKTSRQTLLKWSSGTWNKNYENGKKNYENATLNQIHHYLLEVQIKTCIAGADPGGGGRTRRAPPPPKIGKNKIFWRKIVIFTRNTPTFFAPPSAIGKNMIFWRKIVFFHTKYPKFFAPPSARRNFFKCGPPLTWNPGSAPA